MDENPDPAVPPTRRRFLEASTWALSGSIHDLLKLARLTEMVPVKYLYACPMHPKVTAREAGQECWECQMYLVKKREGDSHK